MAAATYARDIDNEVLIEEIRIRPGIYNRNVKEYNDHAFKKTLWEQVCEKVYHGSWDKMDDEQKETKGAEVIKRWNNLRTCFARQLKHLKDPLSSVKRRKYIYHDKLLFLLEPDSTYYFCEQESNQNTEETSETHFQEIENQKRKRKRKIAEKKEAQRMKNIEEFVQFSMNKLKEELTEQHRASITQKPENDSDHNFALSLVPLLKMVPIENKIDAEIEILNVIKKYVTITKAKEISVIKYESYDDDNDSNSGSDEPDTLELF